MGLMVNATLRPVYPPEKRPNSHSTGGWVGSSAGQDGCDCYTYWATKQQDPFISSCGCLDVIFLIPVAVTNMWPHSWRLVKDMFSGNALPKWGFCDLAQTQLSCSLLSLITLKARPLIQEAPIVIQRFWVALITKTVIRRDTIRFYQL